MLNRTDNTIRTYRFFCPDCGFRVFLPAENKSSALEKCMKRHEQEQQEKIKKGRRYCDARHASLS